MKPGTRCECDSAECSEHKSSQAWINMRCKGKAARLVTVGLMNAQNQPYYFEVPMCTACAEYHETKASARS